MSPWLDVVKNDFWGTPITSPLTHKSYRPVVVASFRTDAIITEIVNKYVLGEKWVHELGKDSDIEHKGAWMFHWTNILLYAAVCYLVVDTVLLPATNAALRSNRRLKEQTVSSKHLGALVAGLWFASHPIHTECVAQLVGRAEVLAALFCLLGTKFHGMAKSQAKSKRPLGMLVSCVAMMICLFLACLCKETAVVLPIVLIGTDIAVALLAPAVSTPKEKGMLVTKPSFPLFAAFCAISVTLGYLAFRSWLFAGHQDLAEDHILIVDNFVLHLSGMDKLRTALYIQAKYLQLLFWPSRISCDYSLGVIEPVFSWTDPSMMLVYGAIIGLLAIVAAALDTLIKTGNSTLVHAIGWTLAPLIPASHIVTIGTPMAERLLFTPSVGVAIMICHFITVLTRGDLKSQVPNQPELPSSVRNSIAIALFCFAVAWFAIMTHQRVPEWADSKTIFEADIKKFPRSTKLNIGLARGWWGETADDAAMSYERARKSQEVIDSYGDALTKSPYVIGQPLMAFQQTRTSVWPDARPGESLVQVEKIMELDKRRALSSDDRSFVLSARGQALLRLGMPKRDLILLSEAEAAFKDAERNDFTERAPYLIYCSYGLTLILLGRKEEAYNKYQKCFTRKRVEDIGYADVKNYCNLMSELSGVLTRNRTAAVAWGDQATHAFETILVHPGMEKQSDVELNEWKRRIDWVKSARSG
mmetsp:Transcript_11964/g.26611  ORF Transcript_11964/g.26611 Transcript_11964/m.26611 type:complete len:699 (+) Transcript_11964:2-2098(+)